MGPGCATSTIRCMHLSRSCARLACAVRLTVPSLEVRAPLPLIFREGTQGTVSTENRSPGCGKRTPKDSRAKKIRRERIVFAQGIDVHFRRSAAVYFCIE